MSRTLSAELQDHIGGIVLTMATLVKVTRQDGEILGFTGHDQNLIFDGVTYESTSAVNASSIRSSQTSGIDNLEIVGMLQSARITDADLLAGLYDSADVEVSVVNWADLSMGRLILLTGSIGEITFRDGQYTAELRGLMQRLNQQVGATTSPMCRVKQLGDAECKVSLAGFQFSRTVFSVTSATVITFAADASASDTYTYGRVIFTSGLNAGLEREVKRHILVTGRAQITLQEAFPFVVAVSDVATLEVGCDRRLTTCISRFSNSANFRGEPYLPGTNQILRRGRR
jgi:phage conserved hypothetical protein BR0599